MKTGQSLIVVMSMFLFGCSIPLQPPLDASVGGKTVHYSVHQRFTLQLDVMATAGYTWLCSIADTTVVRLDSIHYAPKSGAMPIGGRSIQTLYFQALAAGQTPVTLAHCHRFIEVHRDDLLMAVQVNRLAHLSGSIPFLMC
jgi:predicted secreted protein